MFDRFPGALLSRQGAIYEVSKVVYDPIESPELVECVECRRWLDEGVAHCPEHATANVERMSLRRPVVGFASLTPHRNRETLGLQESRMRYRGPPLVHDPFRMGLLPIEVSRAVDLELASFCRSYKVIEDGRTLDLVDEIQICANCGNMVDEETDACTALVPEAVVQGETYKTRAVNIRIDAVALETRLQSASTPIDVPPADRIKQISQSLALALVNAMAIKLDIEPAMMDAWLGPDNTIWIYEQASGGFGVLDDLRNDPTLLSKVIDEARIIIETRPGEHECQRFCDLCLIVPRKSHDVIQLLNRTLLAAAVG